MTKQNHWGNFGLLILVSLISFTAACSPSSINIPTPGSSFGFTASPQVTATATKPMPEKIPAPTNPFYTPENLEKCLTPPIHVVPTIEHNQWPDDFEFSLSTEYVLEYLNTYGVDALVSADRDGRTLDEWGEWQNDHVNVYQDLTNDGMPELAYSFGNFWIFGCKNNRYEVLFTLPLNGRLGWMGIEKLTDANQNGLPELLVNSFVDTMGDTYYTLYEWNGDSFIPILLPEGYPPDTANSDDIVKIVRSEAYFDLEDIDSDGIDEYVLHDSIPIAGAAYSLGPPWRNETDYYKWNGERFVFYRKYFSAPEFRYQAVQDADRISLYGDYAQAVALYRQAISDKNLKWWSKDRSQYEYSAWWAQHNRAPMPTLPPPDPLERDYLEAYASFRMMVLYVFRGWTTDAETIYQTLQAKYANKSAGQVYAQMAQAFWLEHSASQNVAQACEAAIQEAEQHGDEAAKYVGSNMHGLQDKVYSIGDLCPLK